MPPNPFAPPQAARLELAVPGPRTPFGIRIAQALLLMGWFIGDERVRSLTRTGGRSERGSDGIA